MNITIIQKQKNYYSITLFALIVWFILYQTKAVTMSMDMIIIMFGVGNIVHWIV